MYRLFKKLKNDLKVDNIVAQYFSHFNFSMFSTLIYIFKLSKEFLGGRLLS